MKNTAKYQFSLIETSDPFSPDPLNKNMEAVETELARVERETAAALAAKADQTALNTLTQTVESNKSATDTALAAKADQTALNALTQTVASNKTAADTALAAKAAQTALNALTSQVTSMEKGQLLYKLDSYTGTGEYGKDKPCRLAFDFKPLLVVIVDTVDHQRGNFPWVYGTPYGLAYPSINYNFLYLTWEAKAVKFYSTTNFISANGGIDGEYQLNVKGRKYIYLALGVSA